MLSTAATQASKFSRAYFSKFKLEFFTKHRVHCYLRMGAPPQKKTGTLCFVRLNFIK